MRKQSAYARKRKQSSMPPCTYSVLSELNESPTEPMSLSRRSYQLTRMWSGLTAIERAPEPTKDDWRVCSDAVNLMETLITTNGGHWSDCDGDLVQIQDSQGLLSDAIAALAMAGKRNLDGKHIRLDARGIVAIRGILEDYQTVLETLPARVVVRAHRLTEKRLHEILRGRTQPHDVEIIDL